MSYSVATESNAELADYLSWDVAWFFHGSVQVEQDASDPRKRLIYNYDWEAIAAKAVLAGNVDAVCTHAIDQQGFTFFESFNRLPPYLATSNFPRYSQDFSIGHSTLQGLGITPDHLYRFYKAFKSRGIKVGFYLNIGLAYNLFDYTVANTSANSCFYEYVLKEIKWLKTLYDIDFWWIDFDFNNTFTQTQRNAIYQALRSSNGSLVIKNSWEGAANFKFPGDIKHAEFNGLPTEGESFWLPSTTINATEYYIPSGLAYSGLYRFESDGVTETVMWSPANETEYVGDDKIYNQVRDQATFNTWYSYAKSRSVPFFVNMPVVQNDLIATYYDRVKAINLVAS